jgi:long-subunit acyl-CoA synthetase (AMP-forming)
VTTPFHPTGRVRRVTVLADRWRPDGEELTPTGKLRRSSIHAKYADRIDAMYG